MGWINKGQLRHRRPSSESKVTTLGKSEDGVSTSFVEDRDFPFCATSLPDSELPFISAEVVAQHDGKEPSSRLWIVVDEIVYDCSAWADEHPGGDSVVRSFGGQDCSWQFWRFHNKKDMAKYGVALRIGRTQGVANRYPEPKRYARLRGFDAEDW